MKEAHAFSLWTAAPSRHERVQAVARDACSKAMMLCSWTARGAIWRLAGMMHEKRPHAMFTLHDLNERATLCYGQMPLKASCLFNFTLSHKTNFMLSPTAPTHTALNASSPGKLESVENPKLETAQTTPRSP